jgi:hypothetical protein
MGFFAAKVLIACVPFAAGASAQVSPHRAEQPAAPRPIQAIEQDIRALNSSDAVLQRTALGRLVNDIFGAIQRNPRQEPAFLSRLYSPGPAFHALGNFLRNADQDPEAGDAAARIASTFPVGGLRQLMEAQLRLLAQIPFAQLSQHTGMREVVGLMSKGPGARDSLSAILNDALRQRQMPLVGLTVGYLVQALTTQGGPLSAETGNTLAQIMRGTLLDGDADSIADFVIVALSFAPREVAEPELIQAQSHLQSAIPAAPAANRPALEERLLRVRKALELVHRPNPARKDPPGMRGKDVSKGIIFSGARLERLRSYGPLGSLAAEIFENVISPGWEEWLFSGIAIAYFGVPGLVLARVLFVFAHSQAPRRWLGRFWRRHFALDRLQMNDLTRTEYENFELILIHLGDRVANDPKVRNAFSREGDIAEREAIIQHFMDVRRRIRLAGFTGKPGRRIAAVARHQAMEPIQAGLFIHNAARLGEHEQDTKRKKSQIFELLNWLLHEGVRPAAVVTAIRETTERLAKSENEVVRDWNQFALAALANLIGIDIHQRLERGEALPEYALAARDLLLRAYTDPQVNDDNLFLWTAFHDLPGSQDVLPADLAARARALRILKKLPQLTNPSNLDNDKAIVIGYLPAYCTLPHPPPLEPLELVFSQDAFSDSEPVEAKLHGASGDLTATWGELLTYPDFMTQEFQVESESPLGRTQWIHLGPSPEYEFFMASGSGALVALPARLFQESRDAAASAAEGLFDQYQRERSDIGEEWAAESLSHSLMSYTGQQRRDIAWMIPELLKEAMPSEFWNALARPFGGLDCLLRFAPGVVLSDLPKEIEHGHVSEAGDPFPEFVRLSPGETPETPLLYRIEPAGYNWLRGILQVDWPDATIADYLRQLGQEHPSDRSGAPLVGNDESEDTSSNNPWAIGQNSLDNLNRELLALDDLPAHCTVESASEAFEQALQNDRRGREANVSIASKTVRATGFLQQWGVPLLLAAAPIFFIFSPDSMIWMANHLDGFNSFIHFFSTPHWFLPSAFQYYAVMDYVLVSTLYLHVGINMLIGLLNLSDKLKIHKASIPSVHFASALPTAV